MKKKLLTLAVAAALPMATQAANAEVTIYGKIHASIDYVNYKKDLVSISATVNTNTTPWTETFSESAADQNNQWDVTSRATRLGFKGSEDLGNGMKMIWKIETQANIADGSGGFTFRNTYIGLAGNWGTFIYGRHDTPMKMSTGKLDIFADTIADYNQLAGFVDIRANDAIAYVSPNFSGLTLVGAIVPDADSGFEGGVKDSETGDLAGAYSLAAMYSNGGLFLAGAYESLDNLAGGADAKHWRIGAGYDFGNFHIGAVYADQDAVVNSLNGIGFVQADTSGLVGVPDGKSLTINGSYTFGNNVVKAAWGRYKLDEKAFITANWDITEAAGVYTIKGDAVDQNDDDTFDSWAIGLDHNFSKRSKVYVIYAASDVDLNGTNGVGKQSAFSLGMVHNF